MCQSLGCLIPVSDCCLMPSEQLYHVEGKLYFNDDDISFVLD